MMNIFIRVTYIHGSKYINSFGITQCRNAYIHKLTRPLCRVFLIDKHNRGGILKPQLSGKGRFCGNNRAELSNKKKAT